MPDGGGEHKLTGRRRASRGSRDEFHRGTAEVGSRRLHRGASPGLHFLADRPAGRSCTAPATRPHPPPGVWGRSPPALARVDYGEAAAAAPRRGVPDRSWRGHQAARLIDLPDGADRASDVTGPRRGAWLVPVTSRPLRIRPDGPRPCRGAARHEARARRRPAPTTSPARCYARTRDDARSAASRSSSPRTTHLPARPDGAARSTPHLAPPAPIDPTSWRSIPRSHRRTSRADLETARSCSRRRRGPSRYSRDAGLAGSRPAWGSREREALKGACPRRSSSRDPRPTATRRCPTP